MKSGKNEGFRVPADWLSANESSMSNWEKKNEPLKRPGRPLSKTAKETG